MTASHRPGVRARIQSALAVIDRTVVPKQARLAPSRAATSPGPTPVRNGWLLLAEGRPALKIARRAR